MKIFLLLINLFLLLSLPCIQCHGKDDFTFVTLPAHSKPHLSVNGVLIDTDEQIKPLSYAEAVEWYIQALKQQNIEEIFEIIEECNTMKPAEASEILIMIIHINVPEIVFEASHKLSHIALKLSHEKKSRIIEELNRIAVLWKGYQFFDLYTVLIRQKNRVIYSMIDVHTAPFWSMLHITPWQQCEITSRYTIKHSF